ncbi:MAG TPA: hypothetical protein VHA80_05590 [Solirubrobacterales bacterium]|nr:hypothetical protein [Solirubrobacterales bacterium]
MLRIDDERHALIWIHDAERSVSVLVDRPLEGADTVRVVAVLGPAEDGPALEALVEDYRRNNCRQAPGRRPRPRALEPGDLAPAARAVPLPGVPGARPWKRHEAPGRRGEGQWATADEREEGACDER